MPPEREFEGSADAQSRRHRLDGRLWHLRIGMLRILRDARQPSRQPRRGKPGRAERDADDWHDFPGDVTALGNGQGQKKDEGVIDAEYVDVEDKK